MHTTLPWRPARLITFGVLLGLSGFLPSHPARAQTSQVTIMNFTFQPATLTVPVGTTITWTNMDTAPHTATSDTGVWDTGTLSTNQIGSYTFTQAGTFPYHCKIHPYMHGMVVVQAAGSTPAASSGVPLAAYPAPTKRSAHTAQKTVVTAEVNSKYIFRPTRTTIKVGTKVTWVNKTDAPHTVTSKSAKWMFDKKLNENAKLSFVFHKAGTYPYLCKYHPGMVGTIVVKG